MFFKDIICEGIDRGYSFIKIVFCEMKKDISIYDGCIKNSMRCEDWMYIVAYRDGNKDELNCSVDKLRPPSFYIDLLEHKEMMDTDVGFKNYEKRHNSNTTESDLSDCINELMLQIKKYSDVADTYNVVNAQYTKLEKRIYYCDSNNMNSEYSLVNTQFNCFFLQPNMLYLSLVGCNKNSVMDNIKSDYVEALIKARRNFEEQPSGMVKLGIMALCQMCKVLVSHFNAEAIINGASIFRLSDFENKEIILNEKVSILDTPRCEEFQYKYLFDDEGICTKEKYIVKNGRLNQCFGSTTLSEKFEVVDNGNYYRDAEKIEYHSCSMSNLQMIFDMEDVNTNCNYDLELIGFQGDVFITHKVEIVGNAIVKRKDDEETYVCSLNMPLKLLLNDCVFRSSPKKYFNFISPEIIVQL